MKVHDVIPFGERQFLLNFWPVSGTLERFEPSLNFKTVIRIFISDGYAKSHECIVNRSRKPNFANIIVDIVYVLVKTDFESKALASASYQLIDIGVEISEAEAIAWRGDLQPRNAIL